MSNSYVVAALRTVAGRVASDTPIGEVLNEVADEIEDWGAGDE